MSGSRSSFEPGCEGTQKADDDAWGADDDRAEHIAADKSDKTKVQLIFSNVTEDDILLRKEFETLAKADSRFKNTFVLDKPPKNWEGESGYVNADLLKKLVPAADSGEKFKIFVCG